LLSQLGRRMPFWDRTLDVILLTHPDSDHVNGLVGVLERYQVDMVIHRQIEIDSETYDYWLALVAEEGATVYQGEAGLQMTLDTGLEMIVLHPGVEMWEDANNNSVVTRLTYGQVSLLLTGDIEAEVERGLVGARGVGAVREPPLQSTVLKVPHHGSCSSTTQRFLDTVDPEVAIISVGAENRFGHPCEEVLERLGDVPVYRTDEQGAVEVVTDGTRVWVETER
jgi:competence protein ComEC